MVADDPQSNLVERLIANCLEQERRFKASFVEDVCREHPELVARVRTALDADGREQLRADGHSGDQRLGPYRILKELGRGGQAVVYLAEDTRLRRQVALKVLKGFGPLSEKVIERFRREAEVTSKLDHPGICTVYEAGVDNGIPYIAMRLVQGTTLAARIAAAKDPGDFAVDPDQLTASSAATATRTSQQTTHAEILAIVEVVERIARALHAAHEVGVIHRDVKPGNVMVTDDGQPVVLDFGLASDEDGDFKTLTQSGDLFGTPAYMSPEQLLAQRVRLDRRTDVYSLGVTLFECLALRPPFEAPTREGIYQAIQHKAPPDVRKLNPRVSRDLKVVIETALEKDRDKRYGTALAFAEDLHRVRASEPIAAKPVGPIGRTARFAKRRPAMAALVGVLALAVPTIAGLGGFLAANWGEIEQQRQRAIDEKVEGYLQDGYFELTDGSPDRAITAFEQALAVHADLPEAIAGKTMALIRGNHGPDAVMLLEAHPALLASEPGFRMLRADALKEASDPESASSRTTAAAIAAPLGMFLVGQCELNRIDATYRSDPEPYRRAVVPLQDAVSRSRVARLLFHGMLLRAAGRARMGDVVRPLVSVVLSLWPDSGWAHVQAGIALAQIGDDDAGVSALRNAIRLNPTLATGHDSLGHVLVDRGDVDEAIAEHRRAVELEPTRALSHNSLGVALRAKGLTAEAIAEYRKAIELAPGDPVLHTNLGVSLKDQGKFDEAIAEYRKAIELAPSFATAYLNLGVELSGKGQMDEALTAYRKAIDLDPMSALARANLAECLIRNGRADEAIAVLRKGVELDPKSSMARNNLGCELKRRRLVAEAIVELRKAIELDPRNAKARINLAPELGAMGQVDEAIVELRKAVELDPKSSMGHHNLAVQLRTTGRIEEAIAEWRKAIERDSKNLLARNGLAVGLISTGRINDAIVEWRKVLELDSTCAEARGNLGLAVDLVRHEKSLDAVLAGQAWPADPADLLEVALVAAGRGDDGLAVRMWTRALGEGPRLADLQDGSLIDMATAIRERAALSAVSAASAGRTDGDPSAVSPADLRASAHGWLAEVLVLRSRFAADAAAQRRELRWTLERWKTDPRLATVRDAGQLSKLSELERQRWAEFWHDVDAKLADLAK